LRIVSRPLDWAIWCLILGVLTTLVSGQARAQTSAAVDSTSTLAGVYSDEQAKRGKEVYLTLCRSCHVPSTGNGFAQRWAGKTLFDLFTYIYETMPDNNPRSVDEVSNADIIGYLMQSAGMPAGTREVPIAADSLKAIRIEVKKPAPPPSGGPALRPGSHTMESSHALLCESTKLLIAAPRARCR